MKITYTTFKEHLKELAIHIKVTDIKDNGLVAIKSETYKCKRTKKNKDPAIKLYDKIRELGGIDNNYVECEDKDLYALFEDSINAQKFEYKEPFLRGCDTKRLHWNCDKVILPLDAKFTHTSPDVYEIEICVNYPELTEAFKQDTFHCEFDKNLSFSDFINKFPAKTEGLAKWIYDNAKVSTSTNEVHLRRNDVWFRYFEYDF